MLVLLLDSATAAVVVGLAADDVVISERHSAGPLRHGESLSPLVADVLTVTGRRATDLDAVVVGVGPGPYTGLRVGMVSAAALADAVEIPVYGVGSLDALALGLPEVGGTTYVATDARRREVYWAGYADGRRVDGPHVGPATDVSARLAEHSADRVVGAGAVLYGLPGAVDAAPTAMGLLSAAREVLGRPAEPLRAAYLRRPDATEPRPRVAVP